VDAAIIEAARRGDRSAQARLLTDLQDIWFRFCLNLLRDPEKSRDAVQETALRFLKSLPDFRGESQLRTWSLGIALNVAREFRREKKFEPDDHLAAVRSTAGSPAEKSEGLEQQQKIRALLKDLPDRQREVLLLRFFEELSTEETAAAMGCATGTVKATLHQALRALKQKMRVET
jgi:RNA polymerase sigma-70 factor (ECF subfamily)